jgi:hypothetical protein
MNTTPDANSAWLNLLPGENVIKLVCVQFTNFCNKLDCFYLASFSSLVQKTL